MLKAAGRKDFSDELEFVTTCYGSDFNPRILATQLEIFSEDYQHSESDVADVQLSGIVDFFWKQTKPVLNLMSEVGLLLKLVLVMPATNGCSKKPFSVLRLMKSSLR